MNTWKNLRRSAILGILILAATAIWFGWSSGADQLDAQDTLTPTPTIDRSVVQVTATAAATQNPVESHPLTAPLRLAKRSRVAVENLEEYACRFANRDEVKGRMYQHQAAVKFRAQPHSVYMRFEGEHVGREVLYVEGRHDGKLLAREKRGLAALVGTVMLRPESSQALSESRQPITKFGMAHILQAVIKQWESEARFAAEETVSQYYPSAKLQDMDCQVIETYHPVQRQEFSYYLTRLFIDKATQLPVRVEQYDFPSRPDATPPLVEEYTFWDIVPTPGFTEADFDSRNPEYNF